MNYTNNIKITQLDTSLIKRLEYPISPTYNKERCIQKRIEFCDNQIDYIFDASKTIQERLIELATNNTPAPKEVSEPAKPQVTTSITEIEQRGRPQSAIQLRMNAWKEKDSVAKIAKANSAMTMVFSPRDDAKDNDVHQDEQYSVHDDPLIQALGHARFWWNSRAWNLANDQVHSFPFSEMINDPSNEFTLAVLNDLNLYKASTASMTDAERLSFSRQQIEKIQCQSCTEHFHGMARAFWVAENAVATYNVFLNNLLAEGFKDGDIPNVQSCLKMLDPVKSKKILSLMHAEKNREISKMLKKALLMMTPGLILITAIFLKIISETGNSIQYYLLAIFAQLSAVSLIAIISLRWFFDADKAEQVALKVGEMQLKQAI